MRPRTPLIPSIVRSIGLPGAIALSALSGAAWAQTAPLPAGPRGGNPAGTEVQLIRQDSSDCQNSNVNTNDPSLIGGSAVVARGQDGNTTVYVTITAQPNTTYHFFLKCVRQLGDIRTGGEGEGNATFQFPTNAVGAVFGFDMYPEGAPAGNKYQSVQVRMQ
jgi:hypothetical protein